MKTIHRACHWDIFCTVVDNYGDIGVCWRLALQLADEHGMAVRLWVDNLTAFQSICPEVKQQQQQWVKDVDIRHWQPSLDFAAIEVADVVVEGFACSIPPAYVATMGMREIAPVWFNLEYLTAEAWAAEYHGLPSIEPVSGLKKYFFFPGFEPGSGGLLRAAALLEQRDALQRSADERAIFLRRLGVKPAPDALLISLFAYENPALPELLEAMAASDRPLHLLIPQGRVTATLEAYLGQTLQPGQPLVLASLTLQSIPFMSQTDYDRLLWSCDFNFVRGEDSLVRALWAGRPLLWQCYAQDADAHLVKLEAFLSLYCRSLSPALGRITTRLWLAWNLGQGAGMAWPDYEENFAALSEHASAWSSKLSKNRDLAAEMVQFYKKLI